MPSENPSPRDNDQDFYHERRVISPDDMLVHVESTAQNTTDFDLAVGEQREIVRRLEGDEKVIIPLAAETFSVEKEEVTTGVVRIHKTVTEHEETIDTPTFAETVQVERVPRGEWVESIPQIRQEGNTTVIPVVEEVIVVQKRLRLREELRVTKQRVEDHTPQKVVLRREEVTIDRETPNNTVSS